VRVQDVPASHGWLWIKDGWALFRKAPGMWLILTMLWSTSMLAILMLMWPIGALALMVCYPPLVAIWIRACERVDKSGAFEIGKALQGASRNMGQLLVLGGLILLAQTILLSIALALIPIDPELQQLAGKYPEISAEEIQAVAPSLVKVMVIQLGATLPVFIVAWFAPALIAFQGMGAWPAIRWSVYACISNLGALAVYGLIGAMVMVAAGFLPLPIKLPVMLAMTPIFFATVYTAYRDIFVD